MTETNHLATGAAALEAGRWEEARAAFAAALAGEETPQALDGMGVALWWLGETRASVAHTERAYAEFRRAGDAVAAGVAAMSLCVTWTANFDNHAAAGGWLARAERVLADVDPNPLQGWLWLLRGYLEPDGARARELQQRVLELARASGDPDLELCALGDLGLTLVTQGRTSEGLGLIDEAMAGTLGGEHRRLDTVVIACCDMLVACDLAGDQRRAAQWCQVADRFIDRYGCPFLYSRCRTLYGGVLVAKGRWAEAEAELRAAIRMAEGAGPASHAEALARLADLRLRQGRLEEAEALLPEHGGGRAAARTAARLRLARGEPAAAAGLLERSLEDDGRPGIHGERPCGSRPCSTPWSPPGSPSATPGARPRPRPGWPSWPRPTPTAKGRPRPWPPRRRPGWRPPRATPRRPGACWSGRWTCSRLSANDLPHETALARVELARALAGANPELAVAEARNALAAFERLGAAGDADAADALLRSLGATGRVGPKRAGTLTRREQEVLRLVGLGLSNPEIAQRLFISRKTAAHHVSNVLAKLGVRNRAGAIAHATRQQDRD
jgi:DNA-binding CsgD family transcriptional regulator/tetratricopeptide (TPR) repeat protein